MSYFDDVVRFHREGGYEYEGPPRELPGELSYYVLDRLKGTLFIATEGEGNSGELALRVRLILEELVEYLTAIRDGDLLEQLDALVDLTYVVVGTADHHGFPFEDAWRAVHDANMRKVEGPDLPTFREDGKMLKPEGWVGPEDYLRGLLFGRQPSDLQGSEVVDAEVLEDDSEEPASQENGGGSLYGKW